MTETQNIQGNETVEIPRAERVAKLVAQLGAGWARYGLTMGRLALQHSARVLEGTSDLLGELSHKFEKVEKQDETKSH
jgi:hypothetical protein